MKFCSLSSCSYANSVVIQSRNTCILIDCGIRKRNLKPYLEQIGLSLGDIDAVLVTHCHSDHTYGLRHLLKLKNLPVCSTVNVLKQVNSCCTFYEQPDFYALHYNSEKKLGDIVVTPYRLSHDVATVGYIITGDGERLGFITDTGFVPENCFKSFKQLDYLYIESNHDPEMYKTSAKPWHVIKRNLGPTGHLSNEQCGQALQTMDLSGCKLVMLAHLSEDDNEPQKAMQNARQYLPPEMALASAPARTPGLWSDRIIKP
ncbi:MBL fold metallo-hydrolase [Pelotomaculum propionicicum]|uniref:Putative metallo-hydrolase YycJ n=1 Tax=Pelotomaculum propionicicum TaxID=258475 RepID=A0A4Y7RTQ5_9FIRM|nr:MBL fold metallo-hydrolase [Pelotomaculum propionicicum]NLI11842.1 MBL fold metallo-hydrolase [Peptococcaceae bacterium]TEB12384.1 putative metallo-hydrolase YycJ [Pelotomaculum propionicicum]